MVHVHEVVQRVVVVLIKPMNYDDDGFPQRYWRGVISSNSLMVMKSLTKDALQSLGGDMQTECHIIEDGISSYAKEARKLKVRFPEPGTKLVVGLVAVQTNQFRRAQDIAHEWQEKAGATVVIGGFHVSGLLSTFTGGGIGAQDKNRSDVPCPETEPEDITRLREHGIIVFSGEAEEDRWQSVLEDIVSGTPQEVYHNTVLPGIEDAPPPDYSADYLRRFSVSVGAVDTSRGCPFTCSFCSIINVQGRKSRFRDPHTIVEWVRENCERHPRFSFFITDDNFARNPRWEEILNDLISLQQEGYTFQFIVESDLACWKLRGFIKKLSLAGCVQIFMGVESMNQDNLVDAAKRQNKVKDYNELWDLCHRYGIIVHAGYIIGFSHDTPETLKHDIQKLHEAGADIISPFILTPIPGSEDHVRAVHAGVPMDSDPNMFDSFHVVWDHPKMPRSVWYQAYQQSWKQFYTTTKITERIKRIAKFERTRQTLLHLSIWYRWAFAAERTHPMVAGGFRVRSWLDRSPLCSYTYVGYLAHVFKEYTRYVPRFLAEFYRFQHIVFETEYTPAIKDQVDQAVVQLTRFRSWLTPKAWALWAKLTFKPKALSRKWLNAFWVQYARQKWRLLNPVSPWHLLAIPHCVTEIIYTIRFGFYLGRMALQK